MRVFVFIFILLNLLSKAQDSSFLVYNGDTINRTNTEGKKYGKWITFGKDVYGSLSFGYQPNQVVSEGFYVNNRKEGLWTDYYANGNIKNKLEFANGKVCGHAITFHPNGKVDEQGTWKQNRYVGKYESFDSLGVLRHCFFFDSLGKKTDSKNILTPTANSKNLLGPLYKGNPIIQTDTLAPAYKPGIMLSGQHTLYNKNKQMTKSGVFKSNRLLDGKAFIYNDYGVLIRLALYKDGVYIGDDVFTYYKTGLEK